MKWLLMLWISSTLLLTGCAPQVIFSTNFENGTTLPQGIRLINAYAGVVDAENALRLLVNNEVRGQTGEMLIPLDAAVTDYSIRTRLRIHSGELRLWVRGDETGCNGYALTIDPTLDSYRLSVAENCTLRTLRSSSLIDVRNDVWLDVRLEVRGSRIQAFIDGAQFYDVEDSTHTAGSAMVQAVNNSTIVAQIELDHLTIER